MAMRISSSMSGYYNLGQINHNEDIARVNRVERVKPVENLKGISSLTEQKAEEQLYGSRGVKQTLVSPENSFQKAMATDASFAYERMAGKLLDKLPNILNDIKNLPETESVEEMAVKAAEKTSKAPAKVIIGEDGRITGEKAPAPETEDFSL